MKQFYLHRRSGIYYAEFVDHETGNRLTAKSTGTRDRDAALLKVAEWLEKGVPSGPQRKRRKVENHITLRHLIEAARKADIDPEGAEEIVNILRRRGLIVGNFAKPGPGTVPFLDFLAEAWDPTRSPMLKEKTTYGQGLTMRHISESARIIAVYWNVDSLKGLSLVDVTRDHVKARLMELRESGLAAGTVNKIANAAKTPLIWAYKNGITTGCPALDIPVFVDYIKERDILTQKEAGELFASQWKERRAYVGNLLAATTGMRAGEVLAVRRSDIGEAILEVRHSWSDYDGLKTPKNGEARRVPLFPEVRRELLALIDENPHDTPDPFAFYSVMPDRPMDQKALIDGLRAAMNAAGVKIGKRNIVFHSWRYYYITQMANKESGEKIMRVSGHKTFGGYRRYLKNTNEFIASMAAETVKIPQATKEETK